jgi:hypothetical protein
MRKPLALLLVAALAIPVFSGSAIAAKKKGQTVEGSIVLPQGGGPAGPCVYRTQRTLMATAGAPNGVFGYTFDVDPKTANKKFKLEVSEGVGMDIQFYSELGDVSDPSTAPANVGYETPGPGGESGTVPKGYPIAFVCMTEGVEGSFTYTAG